MAVFEWKVDGENARYVQNTQSFIQLACKLNSFEVCWIYPRRKFFLSKNELGSWVKLTSSQRFQTLLLVGKLSDTWKVKVAIFVPDLQW